MLRTERVRVEFVRVPRDPMDDIDLEHLDGAVGEHRVDAGAGAADVGALEIKPRSLSTTPGLPATTMLPNDIPTLGSRSSGLRLRASRQRGSSGGVAARKPVPPRLVSSTAPRVGPCRARFRHAPDL